MGEQKPSNSHRGEQSAELLTALKSAAFWPDDPEEVQLIETHISWVFLTRDFAFKLKKPVRFDFLDFSSLSARQTACEDEIRLNRRLAPDVYLQVLPITRESSGELKLAGAGEAVDYVVQMRRLSETNRFDLRMEKEEIKTADLDPLVHKLTQFYRQAAPLELPPEKYLATIESHVRDNRQTLLDSDIEKSLVKRVSAAQLQVLKLQPELLMDRVRTGHVIEGHGDLRPEHIYLDEEPVIVDCIEFNADFRRLDIADELCFLAMECDAMQQGNWGEQVLTGCLENLQDAPASLLLSLYKSYRATVRAKVAGLRAKQQTGQEQQVARETAVADLQLAESYLAGSITPTLYVVAGLMGAGKSTVARALSESLGLEHLQTDKIRQELFGAADESNSFGEGKYSPANRAKVYDLLLQRAEEQLAQGISVVIDGTFSKQSQRDRAVQLTEKLDAGRALIWCHCPVEIAQQRIANRLKEGQDASEARPELLTAQLDSAELPSTDERAVMVNTTLQQEEHLSKLFAELGKQVQAGN